MSAAITPAHALRQTIEDAAREHGAATIAYLPVGYPDIATSLSAFEALAQAGVDVIEVGVPYSDPLMDGPVIAAAAHRALAGGVRLTDAFAAIERVTAGGVQAVAMSYYNPLLRFGLAGFAQRLHDAGGAGVITPDLTPDHAGQWIEASTAHDLARIFLVAPSSTPERLAGTTAAGSGFCYVASTMGVTGARSSTDSAARNVVARTRAVTDLPLCVGLGVSTGEQAREIAEYADGVIVGSALVRALGDDGNIDAMVACAQEIVSGVRGR